MKSMLTAIIPVETIESAQQQIARVENQADLLELRLDYLEDPSLEALQAITANTTLPYILTLRCKTQGGHFAADETTRLNLIKTLLKAKPNYLDIEMDVADEYIEEIQQLAPKTKIVRSFHNFKETPKDLEKILQQMVHPAVSIYKIVTQANSSLDSLRMMNFVKDHSAKHTMVGHCLGEDGLFSRLAGPAIGNIFIYAAIGDDKQVVSHQATLQALREVYYLQQKNCDTQLFALLGDPVMHSLGHIFHNKRFAEHNINALYVKIRLHDNELADFFTEIKTLPFAGFSITMPLKKSVLPHVDNLSGLQAVNTLAVKDDSITAINTDGIGALDAIEAMIKVNDKKVLVLGAGGAATAIIQTATQRGASITIANRTVENAEKIAREFPANIIDFSIPCNEHYDLLINTLPTTVFAQQEFIDWLSPIPQYQPIVMDANYNRDKTVLLDLCKQYNCKVIRGEEMFVNQALAQAAYWFSET